MKIKKLTLENWRGVQSREVNFADGVTLIEGPNEIGKSTLVEAIHTLFEELDSSNKKSVKSVQPAGQDIGSFVEAEIITGDYHFIYSKSYNKDKKTELRILEPESEQLTGREAHERAEQILEETVDRALWDALLVEQGKEVAGAYLADSAGLARALDDAAGTSHADQPDTAMYSAIQSEYEQYFTLKTGKPRFTGIEKELHLCREKEEAETALLTEVEVDAEAFERTKAEIFRLERALPSLQEKLIEHESNWKAISTIKEQADSKKKELDSAEEFLQSTVYEQQRRQELTNKFAVKGQELEKARGGFATQEVRVAELKKKSETAGEAQSDLKKELKKARQIEELARSDEQYFNCVESLEAIKKILEKLAGYKARMGDAQKTVSGIKIDANGLVRLRKAEAALQLAIGKRDTAVSSFEIRAANNLRVLLNGEEVELAKDDTAVRNVASELRVDIPDVATIQIVPSQSASELEAEMEECKIILQKLLAKYGVNDLADGVAAEAKQGNAKRDLDLWVQKTDELLDGQNEASIQAKNDDLQARCKSYLADRPEEPPMPEGKEKSLVARELAEEVLREYSDNVENQQNVYDDLHNKYSDAKAEYLVTAQEVRGLEKVEKDLAKQLTEAQLTEPDGNLAKRVDEKSEAVAKVKAEYNGLSEQLESVSPEGVELLMTNAREVSQRAKRDLRGEETHSAVLQDRLSKAQADGRFEVFEETKHRLSELETRYAAVTERSAAAKVLWETINRHRDNTRKAYLKPLKSGIEQLGKIVFGTDFAIELGDDWRLISRTQAGKTIPFDDLSVGAKEQIGILTRLAAARIVSRQGGVPLIIDDALGFSDPSRLETMGAAIASAGKECQVILLTCTPGRFMHVGSAEVVKF